MKGDYEKVKEFIKENSKLVKYSFNLEEIYRYQKHSLSEEGEVIMSTISKSFIAEDTFEALTDADISFPNININGQSQSN